MRGKIVFLLILALLVGLIYLVGTRTRDAHVMPKARPEPLVEAGSAVTTAPSSSTSSPDGATPAPSASAPGEAGAPLLDRPLRLVASSWELAAAAFVASGGRTTAEGSAAKQAGLDVRVDVAASEADIENRLARGGADAEGADVAVLPLPAFVGSYERLRALDPQIVHVVAWSRGREVVLGARDGMFAKTGAIAGDVTVAGSDPSAVVLALFALDESGVPPAKVHVATESKSATLAALARPLAADRASDAPSRPLLSTAEATRFVPLVAVAAHGFVQGHEGALAALLRAWEQGATDLRKDVPAAARRIAAEPGAPEPAALLERLGWMNDPGVADEQAALGSSGDSAITVGALFAQDWQLLRDAGFLTSPAPERPPVDPQPLAHTFASPPPAPAALTVNPPADGARTLVAHRILKGDASAIASSVVSLAGIFERSAVRVTTRPASFAKDVADVATGRHVAASRIVVSSAPLSDAGVALVEVLAPP